MHGEGRLERQKVPGISKVLAEVVPFGEGETSYYWDDSVLVDNSCRGEARQSVELTLSCLHVY